MDDECEIFDFHPAYRHKESDGEGEWDEPRCGFCNWPKSLTPEKFLVHGEKGHVCVQCVRTIRAILKDMEARNESPSPA